MLYKTYYFNHSKTYFFVDSISRSELYPFGLFISYSEMNPLEISLNFREKIF